MGIADKLPIELACSPMNSGAGSYGFITAKGGH